MHQLFTNRDAQIKFHKEGDVTVQVIVAGTPLVESDCASDIKTSAKAWLLDHPDDTVYLAEDCQIRMWLRNTTVDHWKGKYYKSSAVYISHIVFLITYAVAQSFHDYGWLGLTSVVGSAAFYQLLWRLGIQNEIESAVATEIAYLLFLLGVPIFLSLSRSHV